MAIPEVFKSKDIIFHYCSSNVAVENILFEKKLRLSSRKESKDPFENTSRSISQSIHITDESIEKRTQSDSDQILKN